MNGPSNLAAVAGYVAANTNAMVSELCDWVSIPSISGSDTVDDRAAAARWLQRALRRTGFTLVEQWRAGDTIAVYGEWCQTPGAPTVLVYSHYDVHPADDDRWQVTAPFRPEVHNGRVYGRGASDAKGQAMCHLWSLRAYLAATGRAAPPVNVKMLVCGEEEVGSTNLPGILRDHRERLSADIIVVSDTMLWTLEAPAICLSNRGTLTATVEVTVADRPLHSGTVSGAVANPVLELARLLARVHDEDGRVAIPGFYDDVREPSEEDRKAIAQLPFGEAEWLDRTGSRAARSGEAGYGVLERIWLRPSVEVTELAAGTGTGSSPGTIPADASTQLAFRLVPDQDPAKVAQLVRSWLDSRVPAGIQVVFRPAWDTAWPPYHTPPEHPAVAALHRAMQRAFGTDVGRMHNGGGSPAALLAAELGTPVMFFGTGLLDDNWHSHDESVAVAALQKGTTTLAYLWAELAGLGVPALGRTS